MTAGRRRPGPGAFRAYAAFGRDARLFLLTTLIAGAALSLYWIDFNLYLASLGLSTSTIGLVAAVASLAAGIASFPASTLSDRFGRRAVIAGGLALMAAGLGILIPTESLPVVFLGASLFAVGAQGFFVVQAPFLTEHSEPSHRNELFAVQFAIQNVTNVVAAILGGVVATLIASSLGLDPAGAGTYRIILAIMLVLVLAGLATVILLRDDRPRTVGTARLALAGEPARFPADPRRARARFGLVIRDPGLFLRLLLPGLLISIGAGQVIPFLNLFVQVKFGLDLASINALFAFTSVGTFVAVMAQPFLAARVGQIRSVVLVQAISIPFLAVLGFSPVLWTVVAAMMVRNSLMNAGNPIFSAFAMEQVTPGERATLSASMSVLWQVGWVIGGAWYAVLQAGLGFFAGYAVNFVTIIVLYATATALYWVWFRDADRAALEARRAAA
jgi:MFS family permease